MDLALLHRSYRTTLILLPVVAWLCWAYAGPHVAIGAVSGGVLGLLNLRFLEEVAVSLLDPRGPQKLRLVLAAVAKCVLVFGVGFALLNWKIGSPLALGLGFPMALFVAGMKIVGQAYISRAGGSPDPALRAERKDRP